MSYSVQTVTQAVPFCSKIKRETLTLSLLVGNGKPFAPACFHAQGKWARLDVALNDESEDIGRYDINAALILGLCSRGRDEAS